MSSWGGNARVAGDDLFVVEADEYDKAFLTLYPTVAVVNNVEPDHLECYGSMSALEDAFAEFAGRARIAIINADDSGARRIGERVGDDGSPVRLCQRRGYPDRRGGPAGRLHRGAYRMGRRPLHCSFGSRCPVCTTCGMPWRRWPP